MTPEQLAAERAAFEAWCADHNFQPLFSYRTVWLAAKEHAARERALDALVTNSQAIGGYEIPNPPEGTPT